MEKLLKTNQDLSKTENSAIKREAISVKGVVVGSRQGGGWLEGGGRGGYWSLSESGSADQLKTDQNKL